MSEQPAPAANTARQQLDPAAADAVRAYAARPRATADQFAGVLEDIAANGLPSVEECTPVGGAARAAPRPPAPGRRLMAPQHGPRRARIAFSDAAAKQLENITNEAEIHASDPKLRRQADLLASA